jgi:hypothetical protein
LAFDKLKWYCEEKKLGEKGGGGGRGEREREREWRGKREGRP